MHPEDVGSTPGLVTFPPTGFDRYSRLWGRGGLGAERRVERGGGANWLALPLLGCCLVTSEFYGLTRDY